tara:strand:- start:1399 stop:1647 length:249 start_codon:yes stop_codon:yes gene_type:complete
MKGIIKAFGSKAITIQGTDFQQYYGPLEEVEEKIKPILNTDYITKNAVIVTFKVDYSKYSGEIRGIKRYYAYEIQINDTIII